MARVFRVEDLHDGARDALFEAMTYDTAAVACCVSRAWNATFATRARHLWARPVFDARHLGVAITASVVRGVVAKARDALTSITFPSETATILDDVEARKHGQQDPRALAVRSPSTMVLGLCATAPELSHVALPDADVAVAHEILSASASLTRLEVDRLWLSPRAVTHGDAMRVLTHPALRVRRLHLHGTERRAPADDELHEAHDNASASQMLAMAATAMHLQSRWLEVVTVVWDNVGTERAVIGGRMPPERAHEHDKGVAAFVAAMEACHHLAEVHTPHMLTSGAFECVAKALAARSQCTSATVVPSDVEFYLPAVVRHMLPRLTRLAITGPVELWTGGDNAYRDAIFGLAAELPNAATLQHVVFSGGSRVDFVGADAFHNLCVALAGATTVTTLELHHMTLQQVNELTKTGLPPRLASLSVNGPKRTFSMFDGQAHDETAPALGALLKAATHVSALTFSDCVWERAEFWELADHLGTNSGVRRLTLSNVDSGRDPAVWAPMCAALWLNRTLEELSISPMYDGCALEISEGVQRSRSLTAFTAGGARLKPCSWEMPPGSKCLGEKGMDALVHGFKRNTSLRSMRLVVHSAQNVYDLYTARHELVLARDKRVLRGVGKTTDEVRVAWEVQQ